MGCTVASAAYFILMILITLLVVGSFMALPLMWYHVSSMDGKLSKILKLLEQGKAGK